MTPIRVLSQIVPIDTLKKYPLNPRRGNLKLIKESLEVNGQYRPIVVQEKTNLILAGNHTWQAAQSLGWTHIAVTFVDCDEVSARKIVLADNRLSDIGTFDDGLVLELLEELDSWSGTGYDFDEFDKIDGLYDDSLPSLKEDTNPEKPTLAPINDSTTEHMVRVGIYIMEVNEDELTSLSKGLKELSKGFKGQVEIIKERLGFKKEVTKGNLLTPHNVSMGITEVVPINYVRPHTRNPREGDIGAISESLKTLGQYRPIVVNKNDSTILIGNHTWQAAKALGWKEIAVTWIEASEEQAIRILLADNKTADVATYDNEELQMLLSSLNEFSGTGFDGDDVDAILRGNESVPVPKQVKVQIGTLTFKVSRKEYQVWQDELPLNYNEACKVIAERLQLTEWQAREVN